MDKPQWFYVDSAGKTSSAVTQEKLKQLYQSKAISDDTYVWNGTTVNSWMKISSTANTTAGLIQYIKAGAPAAPRAAPPPAAAPPAASAVPVAARPSPGMGGGGGGGGGGGRAALLSAIRQGKPLKKSSAADKPAPGGGGGGRGGGGGSGRSMQDEIRERMKNRASSNAGGGAGKSPTTRAAIGTVNRNSSPGGFGGANNRRPSANVPGAPSSNGRGPPPGGRSPPGQGARIGFGGIKKSVTSAPNGSPSWGNKSARGPPGGGGGGGGNAKVGALVSKLQGLSPSDWQFKAIEKILN